MIFSEVRPVFSLIRLNLFLFFSRYLKLKMRRIIIKQIIIKFKGSKISDSGSIIFLKKIKIIEEKSLLIHKYKDLGN